MRNGVDADAGETRNPGLKRGRPSFFPGTKGGFQAPRPGSGRAPVLQERTIAATRQRGAPARSAAKLGRPVVSVQGTQLALWPLGAGGPAAAPAWVAALGR